MCVPACHKKIVEHISRRNFLRNSGLAVMGVAATACGAATGETTAEPEASTEQMLRFSRVVDLTHTLWPTFPTFSGQQQMSLEALYSIEKEGYNLNRWTVNEHTGTHLDAPFHFSNGQTADQIPVSNLVGPLAIIDIRQKAAENADAQLTPDDITAWETQHGQIPEGAIVAMNSAWDQYVRDPKFRNADTDGTMHFPGFHKDATQFLMEERSVKGIMVDTLSLDYGMSPDFAVHFSWLPSGRWGLECVANLGDLPPIGATVIVGGPKIEGATGGPSRVIALV